MSQSSKQSSTPASADSTGSDAAHDSAADAGLHYVSDSDPGYSRRRVGKGFTYRDPEGEAVDDEAVRERIDALAVPPAYTEVWICLDPKGHLQATGRDARGRKQYRYHPRWRDVRDDDKFGHIIDFAEALPRLRRRLRKDLALRGFPRDKVLAIVVALMAETLLRIGNSDYARDNKSYGLTTLRNRHVAFAKGGRVRLKFRGKGGADNEVGIDDKKLATLVRKCQQLPGQALFQYRDDDDDLQPVGSGAVNRYLCEAMGERFTAKDFRTWGATLGAFQLLASTPIPEPTRGDEPSERALTMASNEVVRDVADTLGNTPAVCRKSYIDPSVFDGWRDGRLQRAAKASGNGGARGVRQWEEATLRFLKRDRKLAAKATRSTGKGKAGGKRA